MKICYIADAGHIHTQRWVKYFADRGHEVYLISPMPLANGDIGSAESFMLKSFPAQIKVITFSINSIAYTIQIRKLIKKIKPDILHVHYVCGYGLWAALSLFHPLVLSAWGSDVLVEPAKSRISRAFVKFVLRRADLITTQGENLVKEATRLGAEPDKIKLIHHGVDTKKFRPQSTSPEKEPKIPDSQVVISIRRFAPIYDIGTLVRSVPMVLEQVPAAKFILAGGGPQENYLKDLARSLGVLDSISFIDGMPHDQMPDYLAAADVYVSTSLSDSGTSVSLPEAMACGLAPVVTNIGDNQKWITNGENGFTIPIRRPDLLAEKIIYLLNNTELRDKMGRINRPLIEERANYQKEMGKMEELYKELIK